jgi:hypothetical protein
MPGVLTYIGGAIVITGLYQLIAYSEGETHHAHREI